MKLNCPAKINLFLKLISKHSSGYHELESVFAFIDLYDVLEVKKSKEFSFKITGNFSSLLSKEENILIKVLDFFVNNFQINKNLEINLEKNIPISAGLGGGSCDAAYFMMALNEIFALNLSKKDLQKISLNFGSDIAFFFEKKASLIRGFGEKINNLENLTNTRALMINPNILLSTKEVYENFKQEFSQNLEDEEIKNKNILDLINLSNDLTKSAMSSCLEIDLILKECQKLNCKIAKMSGSGPTCFAIFNDENDLKKAYNHFNNKFPDFFIREITILSNI
jgi:4-diphosphocytidyl-2-C-methyl-D-erythritol kinase